MTRPIGEILHRQQSRILIGIAATGLVVGGLLYWFAQPVEAGWVWSAATAPVLLGLFVQIVISLRKGDIGLDMWPPLSMLAALAFGEPLAANVVAMMYAGVQLLEDFALQFAGFQEIGEITRQSSVKKENYLTKHRLIDHVPDLDHLLGD